MTNHTVPNRRFHVFHRVVVIVTLVLVLGALPRAVFAEAATNISAMKIGIIILSDQASRGEREDACGPLLRRLVSEAGWEAAEVLVIPDERERLQGLLVDAADRMLLDCVITSGGTGLSPRDVTPEATAAVIEKEVPGIAEMLRFAGYGKKPSAVLSRGKAGVRGRCLIVNLPGSPRAVAEGWVLLREILPHAVEVLQGRARECAQIRGRDDPSPPRI